MKPIGRLPTIDQLEEAVLEGMVAVAVLVEAAMPDVEEGILAHNIVHIRIKDLITDKVLPMVEEVVIRIASKEETIILRDKVATMVATMVATIKDEEDSRPTIVFKEETMVEEDVDFLHGIKTSTSIT